MDLNILMLTNNDCYKEARKMTPAGIVVHSTGANNPNLSRYIAPNDGKIGVNRYGNHWNRKGVSKCVHAFIGKDKDGIVCTYQTLPTNICAWGVGKGRKGSYNYSPAYLQFEICEDALKDKYYFTRVMTEAQELCAKWCKEYNISVENVISHKEANARGYGSNHGDIDHWLKNFGENMNDFRAAVLAIMERESGAETPKEAEAFTPYRVKVTTAVLNIRAGAGTNYAIRGAIKDYGVYTIIAEADGKGAEKWGKLESGAGWISLDFAKKVEEAEAFTPYRVKVTTAALNIRAGAGTDYAKRGTIKDYGVYTIIAEAEGKGAEKWGELESGAGWISLDYVKKV